MDMKLRQLGESDIYITPLGLGCWQFSNQIGFAGKFWPSLKEVPSDDIIRVTWEQGINWFDTAEMYGWGVSEQCVANGLKRINVPPEKVIIATKWHPVARRASRMFHSIEEQIQRLSPYKITLYQIHSPTSLSSIKSEMEVMAELIKSKYIQVAGVSNYTASQMKKAHTYLEKFGFPLVSNQVHYSLLHRRIEKNGILRTAKELGMTIIAYSPLEQGLLTGKFHENPDLIKTRVGWRKYFPLYRPAGLQKTKPVIDTLRKIAERHGVTPSQVALNWLIHFHGERVVAIPGATKIEQSEQNVGALKFQLSDSEMDEIDKVSQPFI
ncbi:MAG TPA: aldo/keto reductase [Candidatus Hydrogenedens sp.]|nr:aldo/keto reductase [Candidatus Hydrogenedens sp.]HOK08295.1 aldo/keto reductase [Candidatus Hydrogenedens sp.]